MDKEKLALEALTACKCWICPTVQRGPFEYVVGYNTSAYGGVGIVECSYHADPWESLKLGLDWLKAQEAICLMGNKLNPSL